MKRKLGCACLQAYSVTAELTILGLSQLPFYQVEEARGSRTETPRLTLQLPATDLTQHKVNTILKSQ